jgi:hypothetical protein
MIFRSSLASKILVSSRADLVMILMRTTISLWSLAMRTINKNPRKWIEASETDFRFATAKQSLAAETTQLYELWVAANWFGAPITARATDEPVKTIEYQGEKIIDHQFVVRLTDFAMARFGNVHAAAIALAKLGIEVVRANAGELIVKVTYPPSISAAMGRIMQTGLFQDIETERV